VIADDSHGDGQECRWGWRIRTRTRTRNGRCLRPVQYVHALEMAFPALKRRASASFFVAELNDVQTADRLATDTISPERNKLGIQGPCHEVFS
jgi:hypothetical protein